MIKVLIVDDFAIVRVLLRHVLEKAGDLQVVAMAANGEQAVNETLTHCPDVVVMDISMPTMDGIEATRQICAKYPETRVLMVSTYQTPQHVHRSIEAGASGYLLKDDIGRELVAAVRTIHQGTAFFSRQVAELARLYLHGEVNTESHPERPDAREQLKNFKSNILLLFFAYMILAEFFV
jgi:DNA-binding NarL/FixJ family response regulator